MCQIKKKNPALDVYVDPFKKEKKIKEETARSAEISNLNK